MAVDYVRVVYGDISVTIDLDGRIRIYSDIAEAAASKFLGKSVAAEVPVGYLSLRGPVAATDSLNQGIIDILSAMDTLQSGRLIDSTIATRGSWFLLTIRPTERAGLAPSA